MNYVRYILAIACVMVIFVGQSSATNIQQIQPGKISNNEFSLSFRDGNYELMYNKKTILSRKGSLRNWKKYSNKEGIEGVQCGDDKYLTLTESSGSYLPVLHKNDEARCKDSLMKTIYYVSSKEVKGRYRIIGVGRIYKDWSSGAFHETYIFDTVSKKLLEIDGFSESSEGSGVIIKEGKSGIYVDNLIIAKDLSQVIAEIKIVHNGMTEEYKKGVCAVSNEGAKSLCVNFSDVMTAEEQEGGGRLDSVDLLLNKRIKLHYISRVTEREITKIIQL